MKVKCPFCGRKAKTDADYIVCALCGNGYKTKDCEVSK